MSYTAATRRSVNRRRRTEAKRQILAAARQGLKTKPFRDLTIDDLMKATGFGRTAFYRYFPDREAVLVELLEELWDELEEVRDSTPPDTEDLQASYDARTNRLRDLVAEDGYLLKAVADAAAGDADVEQTYRALMHDYWIQDLTERIREAQALGLATDLDPELGGEALGWMLERFVTQTLDRDPQLVVETITAIIVKSLYGTAPPIEPPRAAPPPARPSRRTAQAAP
jgi:AcrR family transcriptional regulator